MKKRKIFITVCVLLLIAVSSLAYFVKKQYFHIVSVDNFFQNTLPKNTTQSYLFDFNTLLPALDSMKLAANSNLTKIILPTEHLQLITTLAPHTDNIKIVLEQLLAKDQKWLVLFQNSDEIRATGGFIGSYAIVSVVDGKIVEITTEDIYDADGQFTGYISPPPGVKEYLSSGNGLRLPDANWHPDTATSAEQILQFFALGNKQNISGVIFVNIEFAEELLKIIGDIELVDYATTVTYENISEVLRSRRDDFFPGSIQKKHMLSQLLTQVRLRVFSLSIDQINALSEMLSKQLELHNLQVYAIDPKIDNQVTSYKLRQMIPDQVTENYLYLLESNVGINKANKKIEREVEIQFNEETVTILVTYTNNNTPPKQSKLSDLVSDISPVVSTTQSAVKAESHLAYVNYQRVLVSNQWELQNIQYQNQPLSVNTMQLPDFSGIKEIGTLVTVQEGETTTLKLTFEIPKNTVDSLSIQHQPGIGPTPYKIQYNNHIIEKIINSNTEILF